MDWFFKHTGLVIVILIIVTMVIYGLAVYFLTQGLSDGSIAHGIGSFWYQVQQGAKGK